MNCFIGPKRPAATAFHSTLQNEENFMTRHFCSFVLAVFVLAVSGCAQNQTRVGEGAAIGGVLGAAAGEIIGHQNRHDLTGVLVGGALGAAAGAAVGAQIKKPVPGTKDTQS